MIEQNIKNLNIKDIANYIYAEFLKSNKDEIVIINIGTDKCIGDSFAPMLGSLMEYNNIDLNFYGTLENPIHALNLENKYQEILYKHNNAFIIGIDASATYNQNNIGNLSIRDIPIRPGKGIGKELCDVGDISIIYINTLADDDETFVFSGLNNIRIL